MVDDDFYMSLALQEAWKYQGLTYPNPAVGAVIVDSFGSILAIEAHKQQGKAHAELEAIKRAYFLLTKDKEIYRLNSAEKEYEYIINNHNNLFKGCKIYVTLEPCNHYGSTPPCSLLLSILGFKSVIIGTEDKNKIASKGAQRLRNNNILVKIGVKQKECEELIAPFKKWKESRFVFFKIATNLNGTYDTGIISSESSRKFVHKLRDKVDLLLIGGNTVRKDRPILDSRLIKGKAPDILIYSKNRNFDKTIPLFSIKNRQVFIEDNFNIIEKYNFIMIEGGNNMLKATKEIVDAYLIFVSSNIKSGKSLNLNISLSLAHQGKLDSDSLLWLYPSAV